MVRLTVIALAAFVLAGGPARAADPLGCVPKSAQLVVVVDHPRHLAETVTHLDAFKNAQKLPQYRQLYDSPTAQRLFRLLAFAEKELGAKWPDLLDRIAGNGIALGLHFNKDPAPPIAVVCGTDERLVERAFDLGVKMLDDEVAREGGTGGVKVERADGLTIAHYGDFHFARLGTTLLASNDLNSLKESIALARAGDAGAGSLRTARVTAATVLPTGPLAWVWFNFASVKESRTAKDFFESTRKEFIQTLAAGATIDCLRRSDFIAAGLYQEAGGFRLRVRLPAGREGLWPDLALHVPPAGTPGRLPLLEPPGTIYSQSFHLDIGYMWKSRARMITRDTLKDFETGEKQVSRFLPTNVKLGEILELWGPHHRLVVANHDKRPYATEPTQKLPAFGYVATMRDQRLGENLEAIVRAVALLGTLQYGLKSTDVVQEGVTLVAYRFPENKPVPNDPEGIRFNFEPCFAIVGNEAVFASTIELGKKLITELKKPRKPGAAAVWSAKAFAAPGAELLAGFSGPLVTDAVLGRGIGLTEARQETADLVDWVRSLGSANIEIDITDTEYRLDVLWTPAKK